MEISFLLTLFLGLIIGSFVSAVTYRIPRNLDFVKGRSFCDSCKKNLYWYDNIPLLSFLIYGGKSRCCRKRISIRYPLIEIASAIGVFMFPPAYYLVYILTLIIFVIDLEHQIIPDALTWIILFLFTIFNFGTPFLFSGLFAGFLMASLLMIIHLITLGRGMGLGDVKLATALGAFLGLSSAINWLMISFIIGGIFAGMLLLLKKANLKTKLAFGPFLIIAFWTIYLI